MGWPQEQTLDATLPYIEAARKGRFAMLNAIFGGGDKPTKRKSQSRQMSAELFDAIFPG